MNKNRSNCKCQQPKYYPAVESSSYTYPDTRMAAGSHAAIPLVPKVQMTNPSSHPESTHSLHFALTNLKIGDIEQLLSQNQEAVHEKGFNGQTPLHTAVMTCGIQVVDLLLRYKADPNALNNFSETPFHFACKRGNPQVMNLLLQNNANIKLVDRSGKGPLHHAAHGGSVLSLHYLTDACGLSTLVRDGTMSTPLHIVCSHGHTEALDYLLRKERSDLFAHNTYGNNAMHIAANAGNAFTCWRLLEEGGLQLLHEENRDGLRPLDLVQKKNGSKYSETLNLLMYYTSHSKKSGRAEGPVFAWYFHAMLPILSYPLLIILAKQTSRPGALTLAGLIVLFIILYQHSHRMHHICRWPNPVYFTLFLAGLLHSILCFYCTILPVLYEEYRLGLQMMILWNVVVFYVYYVLLTRDPGVASESAQKPHSSEKFGIQDIADGTLQSGALCVVCELIPPSMTHHCKLCGRCYLKTDHHCLFLYRCIASNNHRLFIGFVLLIVVGMLAFLYTLNVYFSLLYPGQDIDSTPYNDIFNSCPWQWSLFVGNALSLIWGVNLLRFQLLIVSKAQTTAYQPNKGHTLLTWKQRLYNIAYFFMGWGYYATDREFTA